MSDNKTDRFTKRREKLAKSSDWDSFDALLITHIINVRYLTGFTGSAGSLLLFPDKSVFLTDFRYLSQAEKELQGDISIVIYKDPTEKLRELLHGNNISALGVEAEHVSYARAEDLSKQIENVEIKSTSRLVEEIRLCKDAEEIEEMRNLADLLTKVFDNKIRSIFRPSAIERDIALELEFELRKNGADGAAFDFIVASGERSSLPHALASGKAIGKNEMVTLDWGAKRNGYNTDNTRTVAIGEPDRELLDIYEIVLSANMAGIEKVAPGVKTSEVDRSARDVIEKAGYGPFFGHGTGHGVGLDIHESPRISGNDQSVLLPGMVITVEPGIYIPGKGGVRIEDLIVVTHDGAEVLTGRIDKSLIRL